MEFGREIFRVSVEHGRDSDLWALPMQTGIFHRSRAPIRLTNGPLHYSSVRLSRDGKQMFAIGTKRRGELVRYDVKSHQFVPFLSGISAISSALFGGWAMGCLRFLPGPHPLAQPH